MNGILPGYGDEETWPAYSGHPNDPRAPDEPCGDCGEFADECLCEQRSREDYDYEKHLGKNERF